MSVSAADLSTLPAGTVLPAAVRDASAGDQKAYTTALAFERVLLGQLTKAMQATASADDEDAGAATKTYTDMLPGTMADALTAGGGIGIADDLYRSLKTGGR
jgi:Rod binding domain-containing protein